VLADAIHHHLSTIQSLFDTVLRIVTLMPTPPPTCGVIKKKTKRTRDDDSHLLSNETTTSLIGKRLNSRFVLFDNNSESACIAIERIGDRLAANDDDLHIVSVTDEQTCALCATQLHGALLAHATVAVDNAVLCERVCVTNCTLFKWSQLNDALAEQVRFVNTHACEIYGI
jgi:hypothetical protein